MELHGVQPGLLDRIERADTDAGLTVEARFALDALMAHVSALEWRQQVDALNTIKRELHRISPFKSEPVDCVTWEPCDNVVANDYNPNSVAPPEMQLLQLSILEDGYTQPIVTFETDEHREVVDGFHRNRVGKECAPVKARVLGFLPVVTINTGRTDKGDRIAATIRHNRARGKHSIDGMTAIVVDLKKRNWSDEKIGRELGMDPDEVLRLAQISGLAEMFADKEFSMAWEPGDAAVTVVAADDEDLQG